MPCVDDEDEVHGRRWQRRIVNGALDGLDVLYTELPSSALDDREHLRLDVDGQHPALRYARGDGKADLWRKRHAIRYLTYLVLGPLLVILALLHSSWWWLALVAGLAAYTATPYRRLWPMLAPYGFFQRIKGVLLVPVIRVVGDLAKMIGYPVGVVWRLRNLHRPEVHWR